METPEPQTPEPKSPFPAQHLDKPGLESELEPRPRYKAFDYRGSRKLEGRRALITGGDSGIGRAVAVLYAREGADVAITYLPTEETDAAETARAVEKEGRRCVRIAGDLSQPEFCAAVVERAASELGGLDLLVSNAAHQNHKSSLDDVTLEEWDLTFATNVRAYFLLVKAALPHLKPGSSIIATSSVTGIQGSKNLPDYSATKGAINTFTKTLASLFLERGIRVNAVAPGPVWTPLNPADRGMTEAKVSEFGSQVPYQRPAQPEEMAPAYVFLASNVDSSYVTGVILPELGGEISG